MSTDISTCYRDLKDYYLGEYHEAERKKALARKTLNVETILNGESIEEVIEKNKYFPMHLLQQDECDMQFVLGVRGDGKTHNAKKFILKDWYQLKYKSYWVTTTKTEMEDMMATKDFHMDLLLDELHEMIDEDELEEIKDKYSDDDIYCHFLAEKTKMDREFLYDDEGEYIMRLIPLSQYSKYKKGKHPRVMRMYYDEFMKETYLKLEAFKIQDLMTSVQREKVGFKMIFLGNAISLNHPMFVSLNVLRLEDDVVITTGEDDKGPLYRVWRWKRPLDHAEEKNGDILWYRIGAITGYNDYAVNNNFKNDEITNIIDPEVVNQVNEFADFVRTYKAQDIYIDVWKVPPANNDEGRVLYIFKLNKDAQKASEVRYALNQEDADDTTLYDPSQSLAMAQRLQRGQFYYDSIATKQALWETIRKWF